MSPPKPFILMISPATSSTREEFPFTGATLSSGAAEIGTEEIRFLSGGDIAGSWRWAFRLRNSTILRPLLKMWLARNYKSCGIQEVENRQLRGVGTAMMSLIACRPGDGRWHSNAGGRNSVIKSGSRNKRQFYNTIYWYNYDFFYDKKRWKLRLINVIYILI